MKNIFSVFIIACVLFFSIKTYAQNIDSISIKISKSSQPPDPWSYNLQTIDSFSSGLHISTLYRLWSNNSWSNLRLEKSYYASSILTEKITQVWDTTQWVNSQNEIYKKSASIDSTITQTWTGAWENNSLSIKYRGYHALDSLQLNKIWFSSDWVDHSKIDFTFSPDSSILSSTFSVWDTVQLQWQFTNRNVWSYDSLKQDTSFIQQNYVSGLWENYFGIFHDYNASGLIVHEIYAGWMDFDSTWNKQNEVFNTYDSLGRLIFVHVDNFPGRFSEATYLYDSLGNCIDISSHYESMGGIVTNGNDHWYFIKYPSGPDLFLFTGDDITKCSKDTFPIGTFAFGGSYPLHYSWVPSTGLSSDTVENPILFADSTISYIITVTDDVGNFTSGGLNIIVYPETKFANVQSISTSCIGCSDGQFIINFSDSDSYNIIISPDPGATIMNDTISGLPAGIYTIFAGNSTKCFSSVIDTIPDDVTLVSENEKEKIAFYPNPFSSSSELFYNNAGENTVLNVMDGFGRMIKTIHINSSITTIDGSDLSPGTYFGVLQSGNVVVARMKLVYIN